MPGKSGGRITVKGGKPARAQRARRLFKPAIKPFYRKADRAHQQRKGHDTGSKGGPVHRKANERPSHSCKGAPNGPRAPNRIKRVARHHRRQDERHGDNGLHERLARKMKPGKQPSNKKGKRQSDNDGYSGNPE